MKFFITAILCIASSCFASSVLGQIKIGENNKNINADAMLDIESGNKGVLLPRVSLVSTTTPSPLKIMTSGMIVYNTSSSNDLTPGLYYSDGTKWIKANSNTSALPFSAQNLTEIVVTDGQTIFKTPGIITDQTKIFLYRNGILIGHAINSNNSIVAEIPCKKGDQIRIIQLL
jgi:hypothetical protein